MILSLTLTDPLKTFLHQPLTASLPLFPAVFHGIGLQEEHSFLILTPNPVSHHAVVHGAGLLEEHCVFENRDGVVTLIPQTGALCSVNRLETTQPCQRTQGNGVWVCVCGVSRSCVETLQDNVYKILSLTLGVGGTNFEAHKLCDWSFTSSN